MKNRALRSANPCWLRCAALALAITSRLAIAELPRTSVLATGDCRDPQLLDSVRNLEKRLGRQGGVSLPSEAEILQRIRPQPSKTAEELQRQIDTAQQQFYQARYTRAIKQLEGALQEIARLEPGAKRWQLEVSARLLEGLVRTRLQGDTSSEEAFARVLRLDPGYKLDPDYFGPSTIERFEKVRREIASAPRFPLEISSTPPGAEVFLEGRLMGRTPYRANTLGGRYQLLLVGKEGATSLQREIRLTAETSVHVDLQFEGAVHWGGALCLADARDESARLKNAVKLGSLLDLDQLVLLRMQRSRQGTSWLAATLLSIWRAEKIREGGLRLEGELASDSEFAELARFVTTGEQMPRVFPPPTAAGEPLPVAVLAAPPPVETAPQPVTTAPAAESTKPTATAPQPAPAEHPSGTATVRPAVSATSPHTWRRPAAWTAGGAGVAAIATGIGFLIGTSGPRAELDQLRESGGLLPADAAKASALVEQHNSMVRIGFIGIGAGLAALAGGAALYLKDSARRAEEKAHPSPVVLAGPTSDGFALSVAAGF